MATTGKRIIHNFGLENVQAEYYPVRIFHRPNGVIRPVLLMSGNTDFTWKFQAEALQRALPDVTLDAIKDALEL